MKIKNLVGVDTHKDSLAAFATENLKSLKQTKLALNKRLIGPNLLIGLLKALIVLDKLFLIF